MTNPAETVELKDYGWCIVELMGHRTRVGRCTEEQVAGGLFEFRLEDQREDRDGPDEDELDF